MHVILTYIQYIYIERERERGEWGRMRHIGKTFKARLSIKMIKFGQQSIPSVTYEWSYVQLAKE